MQSNLTGIILLASGASVRLGKAKQLLKFQDQTLLRRSAKIALQVSSEVVVTLGARREILRKEIEDLPVQIAENIEWENGMGGSVKGGLEKLLETNENLGGVIIMVCDQPLVSADLLEKLVAEHRKTSAPVVACEYENTFGVPAFFSAELFPELLALEAAHGAKTLIKKYRGRLGSIAFPEGAFDIDTPDDYEKLLKNFTC